MYKRLISLLLSFFILVSLVPAEIFAAEFQSVGLPSSINWHDQLQDVAVAVTNGSDEQQAVPTSFADVKPTDWFYHAVMYTEQNGLFDGTGNDRFSPGSTMTRAMYVTVLGRMAGVDVSQYTSIAFTDVQPTAWYGPYVQWAVDKGITKGMGDHTFLPNSAITREQMATLTLRFFEVYNIPYQTNVSLTSKPNDLSDISPWAVDAIVKLWQAGLLTGDANGNYKPRANATRAEAATFCMRSNEVVKTAANPNSTDPTDPTDLTDPTDRTDPTTEPSTPTTGGSNTGNPAAGSYTITFETNGGSAIASITRQQGNTLNNLPVPLKVGFIFQGWYKDRDLTKVLLNDDVVSGNMMLYAKYIESVEAAVQTIPSVTVLDQAPSFAIGVIDATGSMTADQVEAGMKFEALANPEFAGIEATGSNGQFTVAAKGGAFEEGNTYRLTLTDTNLSIAGQDPTTTIYIFSIAKQEVVNVPLNSDLIYVPYSDISNMTSNGSLVASASISVLSASVGNSGTDLDSVNVTNGTFTYSGGTSIQVGDTVAMYEGIRPDQRTADTSDANNGDIAYVRVTEISGNSYIYTNADAEDVLAKPNVIPVSTAADTDGDQANHSLTVNHETMNFKDSKYAPLGLSELTVVQAGDFIAFYNGEFGSESTSAGYAQITSITYDAGMDIIAYTDATPEQITNALDFYQKQKIDDDELLSDADVATLEGQIKQEAVESGFVQEAANYLSAVALQTDTFKQDYEVRTLAASAEEGIQVSVENLTVVPSVSKTLQHFPGYTGASVTLQVQSDIVINTDDGDPNNIVIHLTSTFVEEMRFELGVNGDTQIEWYWFIPIIQDYKITANLDAYTYTGITVTAEIGTIDKDKLADWSEAEDVQNIADEIQALLDGAGNTDAVNADVLRSKYQSILEEETEWVPLISQELLKVSQRVCLGIIEIEFGVNFVISLNPNLTVGIDLNYKSAKRYSVTVRVLSASGSSDTVSLSGDGDYQFKLYVLGTLGLRAGVQVELKAGILSVDLDSIGFEVEAGPYLKLWGYFYYQLTNSAAGKQSKSLGALLMEMGFYFDSAFVAQVGNGWLTATVPIYEKEWPLYMVGAQDHVYDFVYPQEDKLGFKLVNQTYSALVPDKYFTMNVMDMKTGDTSETLFDQSNFTVEVDNPDFVYDPVSKSIKVKDQNKAGSVGNLTITWKNAPLAFTSSPIKRTFTLYYAKYSGEVAQWINPVNGDPLQVILAKYNEKFTIPTFVRPGYDFLGWYTELEGGTKVTIPEKMPASTQTIYAHWQARTDTPYKVEHYLFDPNNGSYKLATTENLQGTTGDEFTLTSDKYADQGYLAGTPVRVRINGNGKTVIKFNYQPKTSMMTFKLGYGDPSAGTTLTEYVGKNISKQMPVVSRPGYTFTGWLPAVPDTMPVQGATYTATWTARTDTTYKIVHLKQNIKMDKEHIPGYSVVEEEIVRGTTDTATITATPKTYEGFTYDNSNPGTLLSSTIGGDGNTVLRLYYTRNKYQVTYNPNGGSTIYSGTEPYVEEVQYGARTNALAASEVTNGMAVFDGWSPAVPETMPASNLTFTAIWNSPYVVTHYKEELNGTYTIAQTETLGAQANAGVTATPKSYEGFTYDSSVSGTVASGTVSSSSPLQLKLYYKRNTYKVTYDANGGTGGTITNVKYGASTAVAPTPVVKLTGYVLKSWAPDLATLPATMPAHDITFTAQWEPGVAAKAMMPTANVSSGEVPYGTYVQLSAESGATIRYTLNGSMPTEDITDLNSFTYSGGSPIYVVNDMTINAVAFKVGVEASDMLTLSYTIDLSTLPFSVSGVEYIGEASGSSGSLLKVTFSKAVDPTSAENGGNYVVFIQNGMFTQPAIVHSATWGGVGHENEVTLEVDSLASVESGIYVSVQVSNVQTSDLSEMIQSGNNNAQFTIPESD